LVVRRDDEGQGVASRRIRSDSLPRLRAETFPFPKRFGEGKHYGVQARRRDGEAAGQRRRWAFFSSLLKIRRRYHRDKTARCITNNAERNR